MLAWRFAVLVSLVALACTAEVTLVPAADPAQSESDDTTGTDTTVVQRGDLTVTAQVAAGDAAIATEIGWTGGVLAGASVRARLGSESLIGTTDSLGRVTFADVVGGTYQISVLRILSDAERALLAPENADVTAFGGGRDVGMVPPATQATVSAGSSRRGSLVISEVFPTTYIGPQHYYFGTYVELYNNSDATIYLDGKLFGLGPFFFTEYPPNNGTPCSVTQQWQADPDGLWTAKLYRLPGTGQQYPLAPGEAAVMATDAIDHSVVDPRWPNLSNARFEFLGASDVDNPAAANISIVGTPAFSDLFGHGPWFTGDMWFIADDVDVATLPTVQPPNYRVPIPRVPRDKILDVVTFMNVPSFYQKYGFIVCPVSVSPVFDAGPAFWFEARFMSFRRRLLSGRVLLRSRSTVNDFEIIAAPTPGVP